ncbi:HD domain-containing protein 2-like [Pyrus ussuriensis x Pyrus communis]|uniref:HD domain-containing protein 2-like n=1 Tax=Pyrus ussuriensis x Pyrus communis TaxID=2448454 RepID=A0A5N5GFW7_9ROSA|nr:HD domain-containing protein 2-like [Pyrus ussuriensis x Pyrus communis]
MVLNSPNPLRGSTESLTRSVPTRSPPAFFKRSCPDPDFPPKSRPSGSSPFVGRHPVRTARLQAVCQFGRIRCFIRTTKRKGWINQGIKGSESIADHMYRMALMSLIAGDVPGLNRGRSKIQIVHETAEAIVGDITPSDGVPKAVKSRMEQAALDEMCLVLGGGIRFLSAAEEIKELWMEYENNLSIESNLGKDFDKVEMILQALEYEMGKSVSFFCCNFVSFLIFLF